MRTLPADSAAKAETTVNCRAMPFEGGALAGPVVTIAIPTCNRARSFLPTALASARAQRYAALEIIVADNASADHTEALVRRCADQRVRYFRHPVNIGPNSNYNFCLERARGDYFLLLHDDDALDCDFVETCMDGVRREGEAALVRTGIRIIDGAGTVLGQRDNPVCGLAPADFFKAWFAGQTFWYCANTLFNTTKLREAGGFRSPENLSEDGFAIARLAQGRRIDVSAVKASFRVHGGELTFAAPQRAARWGHEYLALLETMCTALPAREQAEVRQAGRRFFAQRCYARASHVRGAWARARSYAEVFWLFGCRHWPPEYSFGRRASNYLRRRVLAPGGAN